MPTPKPAQSKPVSPFRTNRDAALYHPMARAMKRDARNVSKLPNNAHSIRIFNAGFESNPRKEMQI
jgi:hypothetical protein